MNTSTNSESPPRLSLLHIEALQKRGLTNATIDAARLFSASSEEVRTFLKNGLKTSDAIGIPFLHLASGDDRMVRFRFDIPPVIDGKPAKYLSQKGAGNLLYFPPGCAERLQDPAEPIYITEGEFKTLAGWQAGLLTVGLIGVWGWRGKGLNGHSQPIGDLDLVEWRERLVVIVFDSPDVAINSEVQRARQALAKELYRRGAGLVAAVNLPDPDSVKVGLDDFLLTHSVAAFQELETVELPPTDIPPFLEPISSLLAGPEEPIEWGIEGLQPVGASGWRIAGPKTGKSWDMLEEAYCLATGKSVYGKFPVPQRRKVVIIEEEDSRRRLKRRLRRIIHAYGGVQPDDAFFRYSAKKGVRLDDPSWQEVLEWEIRSFRPDFIYLDVFTRLHAQDISDSVAMGKIVLFFDFLTHTYGCTIIVLHHTRKNTASGDDHDEIIGSRVLGGWSEAALFFTKTKEKGVLRVRVALKDEPENGSFEPEFLIRLTDTSDQRGTCFHYLGAPAEKRVAVETREKIKRFVFSQEQPVSIKQVALATACSKTSAQEHLDALTDLQVLTRAKRKQTWVYAPAQPATANTTNFELGLRFRGSSMKLKDLLAARPHREGSAPSPQPASALRLVVDNIPEPEVNGPLCSCGISEGRRDATGTGSQIYRCYQCGYAAIVPKEPGKPHPLTEEEEALHGGFYAAVHFLRAKLTTPQPIAPLVQEWAGMGRSLDVLMEARWALGVVAYEGEDGKMWWHLPQAPIQ